MKRITEADLKDRFVANFPGDHSGDLRSRQTPDALYSLAMPTPVKDPELIAWSEELAQELGLKRPDSAEEIAVLGGNRITPSMRPYAACYAGHQFGNWAGQLGDGRAITLGEFETPDGRSWELQLKGAGPTAYSRRADGRAVLRSSVREYLASEAMHHLGVPTTRALSLVSTGEKVMRDMFYDGNPEYEPGAIVMRVAPSFLRFGNFELLAARQQIDLLRQLVNWTIDRYFPHLQGADRTIQWFKEVTERTADLMVQWMRVGFVHGVMNTDNMSILGLTIDYGPYSFLDDFDLNFTPNTTDLPGRRYAFGRQPSIAQWNLGCLAGAIAPLLPDTKELLVILENYRELFLTKYRRMMADKLGWDQVIDGDADRMAKLEQLLVQMKADQTIFHQLLIDLPEGPLSDQAVIEHFKDCFYIDPAPRSEIFCSWVREYMDRSEKNTVLRAIIVERMKRTCPRIILRNYQLHQAIQALQEGDDALFRQLEKAMKEPYSRDHDHLFQKRPDWATSTAGCSMLSCSS